MKTRRIFSIFLMLLLSIQLLTAPAAALETPEVQAKAALLVDQKTGGIVYAMNEHDELFPASLTKIMTALLVLEAVDQGKLALNQTITVPATAMEGLAADGSTAGIQVGEMLTVEQLLYCMLVVSANEACTILGEQVSGSVSAFVDAMNAKAKELGCENTHFVNPHGLHDSQHYTSAWDLYLITKAAMEYPMFMTICDTSAITIPATNLSPERPLYNTNYLICGYRSRGYLNQNAHGVKTGSHSQAGHCLVSTAQKASLDFLCVVLGGDRIQDAEGTWWTYSFVYTDKLYNWAFDNFAYQTVLKEDGVAGEIMATSFKDGTCEIFALSCEDGQYHENLERRLLTRFLNEGKRQGAKYLIFFVGTGDEMNRIMPELGFRLVGRYLGYQKKI